jgi:nucleoside-diphosphate-sugar epimerase
VAGTLLLFEAARKAGVGQLIFISSISAFAGCCSMYGKAKLEVEKQLLPTGVAVVRPGLVYGCEPSGMFGKLRGLVQKLPLIPVIGGGNQPMYLIHEEDLATFLFALASGNVKDQEAPFVLAHPEARPFKAILSTIAESLGKTPRFVSVPAWPIFAVLRMVESSGLRLRVRSDSLVGLLNPDPRPDFSSTIRTGIPIRPFSVAEILQVQV